MVLLNVLLYCGGLVKIWVVGFILGIGSLGNCVWVVFSVVVLIIIVVVLLVCLVFGVVV